MRRLYPVIFGLLLLSLSACIAGNKAVLPGMGTSDAVAEYQQWAEAYEKKGDVQKALFWRQVIQSLKPDDREAQEKVASLQSAVRKKSADHLAKALEYGDKGDWDKARIEAVIALRYDPHSPDALALLQQDRDMIRHIVQTEETPVTLAEKYFHDPDKAEIIAYFNDLSSTTETLSPGIILEFPRLPVLKMTEPEVTTPVAAQDPTFDARLAEAREIFKQKMYPKVVVLTREILEQNPDDQDAQLLLNESYLAIGREHLRKGEYLKADTALGHIPKDFPGCRQALAQVDKWKLEQAEEHYRQGVKHYINENLTGAIKEWQQTLELYPDHIRARENIEKAIEIQEKLKTVK